MEKHVDHSYSERRDAAENRHRILHTARELFQRYDVEHVSMNRIAAEAGIGPGTLYRRFHNKSELCLALIHDNITQLFAHIDAYLKQSRNAQPERRLKQVLSLFILFRENKSQLLAGVEGGRSVQAMKTLMETPLYVRMHELFVDLLDELAALDNAMMNNVFRADMLLMILSNDSYQFQRQVRGLSAKAILEETYHMIVSQNAVPKKDE